MNEPSAAASMPSFRERRAGITAWAWIAVTLPVVALVVLAALGPVPPWLRAVVWVVVFLPMLLLWFPPLVWFWGTELRVDGGGIFFGSDRRRDRPPSVSYAAHLPYAAPWSAIGNVRIVSGSAAAAGMRTIAIRGWLPPQPSAFYGYFPVAHRAHHLAIHVDLGQVRLPEARVGGRTSNPGKPMVANAEWVLPVRDAARLRETLTALGVPVVEQSTPVGVAPSLRGDATGH